MLRVSARVASIPARRSQPDHSAQVLQARDFLLRGQGNDAYWHGVFGGLYAPHLRTEIWRNLVRAETLADQLSAGESQPRVELLDYDADGCSEVLFTAPEYQALLKPSDGATLAALDFRPASATIINSIQRRPEAYHSRLREAATSTSGAWDAVSIHDQVSVKEPNLERFLRYDKYPRHSFRLFLFDTARTVADYDSLQLGELSSFAAGAFQLRHSSLMTQNLSLSRPIPEFAADPANPPRLSHSKNIFPSAPLLKAAKSVATWFLLSLMPVSRNFCVLWNPLLIFLAPADDDRFFATPSGPHNLRLNGILPGPSCAWKTAGSAFVSTLHAPNAAEFWVAPIETVSESEGGFERVYQGSQILALWRPDFTFSTFLFLSLALPPRIH